MRRFREVERKIDNVERNLGNEQTKELPQV